MKPYIAKFDVSISGYKVFLANSEEDASMLAREFAEEIVTEESLPIDAILFDASIDGKIERLEK